VKTTTHSGCSPSSSINPILTPRDGVHMLPDTAGDPRVVLFECAGNATALTTICHAVPNGARVVALGWTPRWHASRSAKH
jgi:threonine dehydrogenase-like Zn-dependent dehydrogenase